MRNILVITLLVGVLASSAFADHDQTFFFRDSNNRCWLCEPGFSCRPCPREIFPLIDWDADWQETCPTPTTDDCNLGVNLRFPSPDMTQYYQCGADGSVTPSECPCDTIFDVDAQNCVAADLLGRPFCFPFTNSLPVPCNDNGNGNGNGQETTTTSEIPTAPELTEPTDDTDETTDPTDDGENGNGVTTTPRPCVCVIWFPCACNPCWGMPCNSCSGCPGGMGGMGMGGMGMGGMGMGGMGGMWG